MPENVSWKQIQNFWPLTMALIAAVISFWSLNTKLEVLINRVENLITATNQNSETAKALMVRLSDHENRITKIETRLEIK